MISSEARTLYRDFSFFLFRQRGVFFFKCTALTNRDPVAIG